MGKEDDWIPRCVKFSVFFMNSLYWFLGLFAVGVGLHVHVDQIQPMSDLVTVVVSPACLLITLGSMVFATATLGCIGALRENICLLRSYLIALLFLLMIHVILGAVSFLYIFTDTNVRDSAEMILHKALINYRDDEALAEYINYVQSSLQCCGIGRAGYKDWSLNPYFRCAPFNENPERCGVPASCCKFLTNEPINLMCGYGTTNDSIKASEVSSIVYTKGCVVKIEELLQSAAVVLGVVAFGVAVTLLCGVLLSARMINCLEDHMKEYLKEAVRFYYPKQNDHHIPRGHIYHIKTPTTTDVKRSVADS